MSTGNVELSSVALFAIHLHNFQVRKDEFRTVNVTDLSNKLSAFISSVT
jgi:hypothetical protein